MATLRYFNGNSTLCGPVADQAALHGLLVKVRDLGLVLISQLCQIGDGLDTQTCSGMFGGACPGRECGK